MQFRERYLKPYSEPVSLSELSEGQSYYCVTFADEEMQIPVVETLVFLGMNLGSGDTGSVYFQDIDSYQCGVRYETATAEDHAVFVVHQQDQLNNIFGFEQALEVWMRCSIRRKRLRNGVLPG